MASYSCFILAFFIAISFSSMDTGLAARHLMQTIPSIPTLPKPTLPPLPSTLPTIPSLPKPTLPTTQPPLPTIPTVPQVTLPPLPATSMPNIPSIPTIPNTFPSIPFFSPPPSSTSP